MSSLWIIPITIGSAVIGGLVGVLWGEHEGGDFNIAPVIYGPFGMAVGGVAGAVLGSILAS